jgi:hypothetical protein
MVPFPASIKNVIQRVQIGCGSQIVSYSACDEGSFPAVTTPRREANYSPSLVPKLGTIGAKIHSPIRLHESINEPVSTLNTSSVT